MDKTRIAVAGAGYIGIEHIGVTRRSPACSLSAVVDPSPGAVEVAARAGVPLYRSLGELFEKDPPDGVVLATPNRFHVEHALACMQAGMPMLLEKPIAPTVEEAELVVRKADDAGVRILIGHHRAHSPIIARAKEFIDEGRLGALVAVMGSALFFKPERYYSDAPWRSEPGAGPILLNMIHEVHSLRMLCGEIVAVQAFSSHATRKFQVEDTVAINFRFARGALGTFLLSDTAASARSWGLCRAKAIM
jgi:predicted dehydrogenase